MPSTLIIRHQGEENGQPQFVVARLSDGKTTEAVSLDPPDKITLPNRGNSHLANDLRWYLEQFLVYPFPPNIALAKEIQEALEQWGKLIFSKLFQGKARDWYQQARRENLNQLTLKIASDDPRILAWPWEALYDPEGTTLAHTCRIERQLNELHDPLPIAANLPTDCINILLVIARPYGDNDVGYHVLARPLVELSQKHAAPVQVHVLRPPTFDQLRRVLAEKPGFYHIVHFDGHGGYGDADHDSSSHQGGRHSYKGPQGKLIFETELCKADPIDAEQLTQLLTEHNIPIAVLNACQSARIDETADDPFASVAAALLKAGIRSVVAMGYNLYVSAAQQFVPAFYNALFQHGSVADAVRAGRQAMLAHPERSCLQGNYPLQDWLVPVLYQQQALDLTFSVADNQTQQLPADKQSAPSLPPEAIEQGDYGFIGRDRAIQALERTMRLQPQAGLLIHGMAGVGKTTLAQGFLQWLQQTHGLHAGVFWFRFDEIRSVEFVINQMVAKLFDNSMLAAPLEQKFTALYEVLKEQPFILVWDNFESATGIDSTEVTAQLSDEDRALLKRLLKALRQGKTKVIITSRSTESWLSTAECYRLPLGGLQGEECWHYCNAVVRDLGLTLDRGNPIYGELMTKLEGHPLAMRAILLRLEHQSAEALLKALEEGFSGAEHDESTQRIYAALDLLEQGFPEQYHPVLQLVGLHQRYVDFNFIEAMLKNSEAAPRSAIESCFVALERGGLITPQSNGLYAMHPALNGYLRLRHPAMEPLQRAFVDVMWELANHFAPKQLHEQRAPFYFHGASFHCALALATNLKMTTATMALTQSLAIFAQNSRDYQGAGRLYEALAENALQQKDDKTLATTYHQLGIIAQEQRDFERAEQWHLKSLAIEEKQGNQHGAALSYHQLGIIAQEQRDFERAEQWVLKSLAIKEKQGNQHGAASSYYQLGRIAEEQRDFERAEQWYLKSLAIEEKQGNEHGAALSYHQLGIIAEEQRDFERAEQWYLKSLAIKEKQGNQHGTALSYHQLGMIAQEQRDFERAEQWTLKSLAIKEKQGNQHGAASSYHQLGIIAQQQRDFERAEQWTLKSLTISEKQGNEHGVAGSYHQLGRIAEQQRDFERAGQWFIKSLLSFMRCNDSYSFSIAVRSYIHLHQEADEANQAELTQQWQQAGLDEKIAPLETLIAESNRES